jgi:hypothetical protein
MWRRSRGSPDLPEFAAWRRQIFVHVAVCSYIYFTTVKEFAVFSYPYHARIKLCLCSYFAVAKYPPDYIYYAGQQFQLGMLQTRHRALATRTIAVRALA